MGLFALKDVQETLANLLGITEKSSAVLCAVQWKNIFKEVCSYEFNFSFQVLIYYEPKELKGELKKKMYPLVKHSLDSSM